MLADSRKTLKPQQTFTNYTEHCRLKKIISLLQTVISPELRTYASPPQDYKMVMIYNHQAKRTHIR